MTETLRLEVHDHFKEDVYRDRVRIPVLHRGTINEGRVARLSVNGKHVLVEVRGLANEQNPVIRMDEITKGKIAVDFKETYTFDVREVGWLEQFRWAWNASDSASRIAARLGLLGIVLGFIGVFPLVKDLVLRLFR